MMQEVRVRRAVVRGIAKPSTKTHLSRDVELADRAWDAFEAQRRHTQLAGAEVFHNPVTGARWADLQPQLTYWPEPVSESTYAIAMRIKPATRSRPLR